MRYLFCETVEAGSNLWCWAHPTAPLRAHLFGRLQESEQCFPHPQIQHSSTNPAGLYGMWGRQRRQRRQRTLFWPLDPELPPPPAALPSPSHPWPGSEMLSSQARWFVTINTCSTPGRFRAFSFSILWVGMEVVITFLVALWWDLCFESATTHSSFALLIWAAGWPPGETKPPTIALGMSPLLFFLLGDKWHAGAFPHTAEIPNGDLCVSEKYVNTPLIPPLAAPCLAGAASPGACPGLGAAISAHFPFRLR